MRIRWKTPKNIKQQFKLNKCKQKQILVPIILEKLNILIKLNI